jgi:hypothetical protein
VTKFVTEFRWPTRRVTKEPRDEIRDEKFLVLMPASYRGRLEEAAQGHIDPDA